MTADHYIEQAVTYVKEELADAEGGHDWWHTYRVWKLARRISEEEQVNQLVVELSAILHDVADAKFHDGDEEIGPVKARTFLKNIGVLPEIFQHVEKIIRHMSFRSDQKGFFSPELAVVRDADRLDALGAIGISRAFNFGGFVNSPIHNPYQPPNLSMSKEEYKKRKGTTINHFYEKLLLLKDLMHTRTGKQLAIERHRFMEEYLERFLKEWDGLM